MDVTKKADRRISQTARIIISVIVTALFALILYHVYGGTAWQSNLIWIAMSMVSCIFESTEEGRLFFKSHKAFLIVSDLVLGFCLIGNYLFCYPLDKSVAVVDILEYLLFASLCSPIVVFVSSLPRKEGIRKLIRQRGGGAGDRKLKMHLLLYISIPIITGLVSMAALNPCIVSYDAFEVIAEAKGLTPIQAYAGVPYVLWFRLWLSVIDSVSFLCLIQILIYALTVGYFFFYVEKHYHLKFGVLFGTLLIFSIFPNNIMMLITLSKDVYYAIFLCLMMIALMLIKEEERIRNYVFLGLTMFLVWSIRQSGIAAVIFVAVICAFLVRKKRALIITAIASAICSLALNIGLMRITNAEPTLGGMKYIALYQDLLGVYYAGGTVSKNTEALLEKGVGDKPEFKNKYTPYWAYYDYYYPELEDEEVIHFIKCYIDTFIRNPGLMCRAILCRLDMAWDIRPGVNALESWQWRVENSGGSWTDLVCARQENALTIAYNQIGEKSKEYPYKDFVWRVGIWNVIFLLLLINIRDKRHYLVFLPFFGFIIAYALSLGWSHYRYYWADELLMLMSCVYIIANIEADKLI